MAEIAEDRSSRFSRFTFLALVASLGFIQAPFSIFGQDLVVTDLVFLAVLASWIFDLAFRRRWPRWQSFYWLLIFYLAALSLSCLFSVDPRQSFLHMPAEIYLAALAFIAADATRTAAAIKSSLIAWLLGSAFAVIVGVATVALFYAQPGNPLLESLTYHYGAVPVGDYPRITATFISASMFCNYLNVSLVLTIVAAASGRISDSLAWIIGSMIFLCSLFTISVGLGGIFLALGLAFFLFSKSRPWPRAAILTASILAAAGFLFLSAISLSQNSEPGVQIAGVPLAPSGRILVWHDAFQTFRENFLTGHGLGLPVANVAFRNSEGGYSLLTDAHDTYLNIAAQSGVVGLAAILGLTIYLLRKWKDAINARRTVAIGLGAAFFCAVVYQGLTGSFEHARHLWVLMGLFVGSMNVRPDQNS